MTKTTCNIPKPKVKTWDIKKDYLLLTQNFLPDFEGISVWFSSYGKIPRSHKLCSGHLRVRTVLDWDIRYAFIVGYSMLG